MIRTFKPLIHSCVRLYISKTYMSQNTIAIFLFFILHLHTKERFWRCILLKAPSLMTPLINASKIQHPGEELDYKPGIFFRRFENNMLAHFYIFDSILNLSKRSIVVRIEMETIPMKYFRIKMVYPC